MGWVKCNSFNFFVYFFVVIIIVYLCYVSVSLMYDIKYIILIFCNVNIIVLFWKLRKYIGYWYCSSGFVWGYVVEIYCVYVVYKGCSVFVIVIIGKFVCFCCFFNN